MCDLRVYGQSARQRRLPVALWYPSRDPIVGDDARVMFSERDENQNAGAVPFSRDPAAAELFHGDPMRQPAANLRGISATRTRGRQSKRQDNKVKICNDRICCTVSAVIAMSSHGRTSAAAAARKTGSAAASDETCCEHADDFARMSILGRVNGARDAFAVLCGNSITSSPRRRRRPMIRHRRKSRRRDDPLENPPPREPPELNMMFSRTLKKNHRKVGDTISRKTSPIRPAINIQFVGSVRLAVEAQTTAFAATPTRRS